MNKIEVAVLHEAHENPAGMMMFLAKLTQRGHSIKNMDDLQTLYLKSMQPDSRVVRNVAHLPHGTIKRFTPITVAVVGASRRFLAQARTHQVGFNFVSASLQYSDYSAATRDQFVIPYDIMQDAGAAEVYIDQCVAAMQQYADFVEYGFSNDSAGYVAPQGLRNILIMQANHEAWSYFIRLRGCNRNTPETQYVTLRIWEELVDTIDGEDLFSKIGPDCMYGGRCREGKMSCGKPILPWHPCEIIDERFPHLRGK